MFATEKRKRRVQGLYSSHWRWHLAEVFVKTNGELHYLWRAVGHEGEVRERFVTKQRDKKTALKILKKTLKRRGPADEIMTDLLRSYGAALRELGICGERAMLRLRSMEVLQKFVSGNASIQNHFNQERAPLLDRISS